MTNWGAGAERGDKGYRVIAKLPVCVLTCINPHNVHSLIVSTCMHRPFCVCTCSCGVYVNARKKNAIFQCAVPALAALVLSTALTSFPKCGLKKAERVSVAIETCYQNVGVATAVALSMFHGSEQSHAVRSTMTTYYVVISHISPLGKLSKAYAI